MARLAIFLAVAVLCTLGAAYARTPVNPATWSYDTGYAYLLYSYSAYCNTNSIKAWNCKWCDYNDTVSGFRTTSVFIDHGELAYLGVNDDYKQIVLVFRGSSDIANWLADFDVSMIPYSYCKSTGCMVHEGFSNTWNNVKGMVIPAVQALVERYNYPVVVTGHSLGAAVATLASVDLVNGTTPHVYLWTYGCPRVGNAAFANWFPGGSGVLNNQRVVNDKDIVPHTPSEEEKYRHLPQEIWEQKNPNNFIECDPKNGEDPKCSDSVLIYSVGDHTMYYGLKESCP